MKLEQLLLPSLPLHRPLFLILQFSRFLRKIFFYFFFNTLTTDCINGTKKEVEIFFCLHIRPELIEHFHLPERIFLCFFLSKLLLTHLKNFFCILKISAQCGDGSLTFQSVVKWILVLLHQFVELWTLGMGAFRVMNKNLCLNQSGI